jgi:hypothetical protein
MSIPVFIEINHGVNWTEVNSNGTNKKTKTVKPLDLPDLKDYKITTKREQSSHKIVTVDGVTKIQNDLDTKYVSEGVGAIVCDTVAKTCTFYENLSESMVHHSAIPVHYTKYMSREWGAVSLKSLLEKRETNISPIITKNEIAIKYSGQKQNIVHIIDALETHLGLSGLSHEDTDSSGNSGTIWVSGENIPDRLQIDLTNAVVTELAPYGVHTIISVPKTVQ